MDITVLIIVSGVCPVIHLFLGPNADTFGSLEVGILGVFLRDNFEPHITVAVFFLQSIVKFLPKFNDWKIFEDSNCYVFCADC